MERRKTNKLAEGAPDAYDPLSGCPCKQATTLTFSEKKLFSAHVSRSLVSRFQCNYIKTFQTSILNFQKFRTVNAFQPRFFEHYVRVRTEVLSRNQCIIIQFTV